MSTPSQIVPISRRIPLAMLLVAVAALAISPLAQAQQPTTPPAQQPDQAAPASGGPAGDTGVIAVPRKKNAPEDAPPPAPAAPKDQEP
jgi:hypothetical protein